jgi:short-subunit dehydrogenase
MSVHMEVMDLTVPDAAQRLYVASKQRREHVDLLVNNAGFGAFGPFIESPMPRIQEMLRLHVNTIAESMRLFLPGIQRRRNQCRIDRRLVLITVYGGIRGDKDLPYYVVTSVS